MDDIHLKNHFQFRGTVHQAIGMTDTVHQAAISMADTVVTEGKAKIFTDSNIFYNPVQEFNRDIR